MRGLEFRWSDRPGGLVRCHAAFRLMKYLLPIFLCGFVFGCGRTFPNTAQGRLDEAIKNLTAASGEEQRFYALDDAAKESYEVGKIEDARKYARALLTLSQKFQGNWN